MQSRFYSNLQKLAPDCEKANFLLAVSGGKDSTVLVHLFAESGLAFDIAHCNFHLRGDESNADMLFVQNLAEKFGKKLLIKEFDTYSLQKGSGESIEMAARKLRYDWFRKLSGNYDYVVTAHHADDNAETLLLNLARGTGLKGMTGIPDKNGKIIRPLLPFSAEEILQFAQTQNIAFRIDQSNLSEQFLRNKIRISVLPKLKEINPDIISTFSRNIQIFNQLENFVFHRICQISAEISHIENDRLYIDIAKLVDTQDAEFILYEMLQPYHFDGAVVKSIVENLQNESGKIFLSATHQLLKDREFLIVKELHKKGCSRQIFHSVLEMNGSDFSVEYKRTADGDGTTNDGLLDEVRSAGANILYADADKLVFPIEVRNWESGDWFIPLGMNGKKKLSDFFINQKMDCYAKQEVRLLLSGGEIAWVIGKRTDKRFCIDKNTKHYYKIEYNGRI